MKTRKTFLAASVVALGLLGLPVLSQAYAGDHCRWSGPSANAGASHGWERWADRLNLSKEQRESMRAINVKYQPELNDLRQRLSDNRNTLAKMDAADAKLAESAAAQGKTVTDMIVTRKNMRAEMDKVLTEEQRQTLDKMREQRGSRHFRHEGMRPG
jgi:Spy/CpxP family protein refolding chaperone